jgi:hypothetical protein
MLSSKPLKLEPQRVVNENHRAEPCATDNAYACHASCFAPVAPSTGMSDLGRSAKNETYSIIYFADDIPPAGRV